MTINKVILVGNVGNKPDINEKNGAVVAKISVATTEKWKDKQGAVQEKTEWHRVVFFGRTAEVVRDYVFKGSQVYIEGRLQTSKYTDKEGIERYSTDVIGSVLKMLGKKDDSQAKQEPQKSQVATTPPPPDSSSQISQDFTNHQQLGAGADLPF